MAQKAWVGTTYGAGWLHRALIGLLKVVDVRLVYAFAAIFVIPVCLVLNASRGIAYRYFRQRHGYSPLKAAWKTYVNHCIFATVVIDRFAMYAGERFPVDLEGYDHFQRLSAGESAFVQLSAHVGNYELAGYSLASDRKPFNALVFFGEKESVMQGRNQLFGNNRIKMIPVKNDMSHLFEMNRVLQEGEILSMPADRFFGSSRAITLPFLGQEARFPQGPFSVATARGVDVLAVNVMKVALKRYHIYITPLNYDKQARRNEQIDQLAKAYVAELERVMRLHPTQWYNYYEFWQSPQS